MSVYILRRLLLAFVTWLIISLISYAIFSHSPSVDASAAGWFSYIHNVFQGDLGIDKYGYNVADQISQVLPISLELIILSFIVSLIVGTTLGTLAGVYSRASWINTSIRALTLVGHSIPVFIVGALLIIYISPNLTSIPSAGRYNLLFNIKQTSDFYIFNIFSYEDGDNLAIVENIFVHLLLPVLSLSLLPTTEIITEVQTAVNRIVKANYIKVATSKGMAQWEIVYRHILPNAMPSIMVNFGVLFSSMMSLLLIVESIFDWPGIGRWLLTATMQDNYTAISGCVLVIASLILILSILSEMIGTVLNPLIRKQWNAII